MGSFLGWLVLLTAVVRTQAQKKPLINVTSECLGNIIRISVGPLGGNSLEVAAVVNNSTVIITSSLASQCGFSVVSDRLGSTVIYASVLNCFSMNVDDKSFKTMLNLRLYGSQIDEVYQVAKTCRYSDWSSREIVCSHNYMEVSVKRAVVDDYIQAEPRFLGTKQNSGDRRRAAEKTPIDAGFKISTVVFFLPEDRTQKMRLSDAQRRGYGLTNTPTRLVVRSPMEARETYTQMVSGVPMTVLSTSVLFQKRWLATQIDTTAACPLVEGSVFFTPSMICWYLPKCIDPLVSSDFHLSEVHMGIKGERLDAAEMASRQYSLSIYDVHITVEIPIGAAGGYLKSYFEAGQYFTSYTIEPMLELLWTEDEEDTRYKVFLPVTTPLLRHHLKVLDDTVPEEQVFKMVLGSLAPDVVLVNITFPNEILSVADCNIRGFNVQEHMSYNGSKVFTLQVPFTDRVVRTMKDAAFTIYYLDLTFGLLVLPEQVLFSHTSYIEAKLASQVAPSISGSCDHENFYITVKYGTHGLNFQTVLGKRPLTQSLAEDYNFMENGTHFSLSVPMSAPVVSNEAIELSSIRSRLDVVLKSPHTNKALKAFSLACSFVATLTECYPNGTITALAVKLESVPSLNPAELTLRDPNCGPSYSDDRFAYFVFTASTCGTTRRFLANSMLYENEISLPDELEVQRDPNSKEPFYELKISCYYDINMTRVVTLRMKPVRSKPHAEAAQGELEVAMRLALDNSYRTLHQVEEYPILKYLQQPLYFEVELMKSTNPKVSLELENCWATVTKDRLSQPRWNLIINGCANPVEPYEVVFHPVWVNDRVTHPAHFKRFEIKMSAFTTNQDDLSRELFVHCDVVICDPRNPLGGVCTRECPNEVKGQRREASGDNDLKHVSVGPIIINDHKTNKI
ncbi:uncharacterized protein LOC117503579 [Thalassophryne amazonica]|uniref:uncharacterized protein LOC117503579 n=1 Tax=Thalassophryne amazonica TaxID=390379 RepID=UPI001470F8DC|nr:uncharacterized protein LOC117503579 [Thalassophryne amazonica]